MIRCSWILLFLCLICTNFASATIIEETGSLEGFVLGEAPTCAYDNFVSHISEGIADEGYNDYGPEFLDPQTNGFGSYTVLEEGETGDSILSAWQQIFTFCMQEDWNSVDTSLSSYDALFCYELVHLLDDTSEYYMLRERLDSSFFDDNVDTTATDDVTGSFQNGWGLFVFRVNAPRDRIIVQMPHPNDDFLSDPVGLRLFTQLGARLMMIAGAGREVVWSEHPPYNNGKSLSDPTRNERAVFHVCHQVAFTALHASPEFPCLTFQMHSYDTDAHETLRDIQMSVFRDDDKPNLPVRDRAENQDVIHFLGEYPVSGSPIFPGLDVRIDAYLGLYSNPPCAYYGTEPPITLMSTQDLSGWSGNKQALFCHDNHDIYVDPETFVHIELDEFPDSLDERMNWSEFLPGSMPATMTTYEQTLAFYGPLIDAIDSAIAYNEIHPDTMAPDSSTIILAGQVGYRSVALRWSPQAKDRNFESYWIYYDIGEVTMSSPSVSRAQNSELWDFELLETTIDDLDEELIESYMFSIAGKDIFGRSAPLTTPKGVSYIDEIALTIAVINADSIRLKWQSLSEDSVYTVYKATEPTGPFEFIGYTDTMEMIVDIEGEAKCFFQVRRILVE